MKEQILAKLSPRYPWGEQLHWLPETGSTNDQLKLLARQGAPHGTAILADRQTGGRGRKGRTFLSPAGMGIYLSFLLRPDCGPADLMHLTCATGIAMCEAIEAAAGFRPGIKWTNDLVYGKKKLGGILTELGFSPQGKLDYAIIGIGINCRQRETDFAPEIRDVAGSLAMVTGRDIDRSRVAAAMLEALHRMDGRLLSEKEALLNQYRRDCITLGREISLVRGKEVRHGKALDIDGDGALVVAFPDGHVETVNSGEVSIRGLYNYV